MNSIPFTVYCADVAALAEKSVYDALYSQLSESRRRKTDALRFEKDRMLSGGAGILLQRALNDAGLEYAPLEVGEHGKPFFPAYPGFHFNLSHSGTKVLCATADRSVGCDVEKVAAERQTLAKRFFSAEEYAALLAQPTEEDQCIFFYRLWALKESFLKATGRGLSVPLNAFSVQIGPSGILLTQDVDLASFGLYEFEIDSTYRCACCIRDDDGNNPPQIISIDLAAEATKKADV